jgi:hypothetical protein
MRAQSPSPSTRVEEQQLASRDHEAHEFSGFASERCLRETLPQ